MKRILTVAGSDSGGGAGIQADLKAITVLGAYGMSVITALTAQNTVGVQGVREVDVSFIRRQMDSVLEDIGADAAKTGMLATPEIVEAVADGIREHHVRPVVVDPVMVAKSGDSLLSVDAQKTIKKVLLPLAFVVTPNIPEAEVLSEIRINGLDDMREAARIIHGLGPEYVVIKGGHLSGDAVDLLFDGSVFRYFETPRIKQNNTHGTGCTFSAALATFLGQGLPMEKAVGDAKRFITRAISQGIPIGSGHGPTNPYSHISAKLERETVMADLKAALEHLLQQPLGKIIPEVRSNLGYAISHAAGNQEIASIPGRITQIGDKMLTCREPAFGASRHVAGVIRAAMAHFPNLRSGMNIRCNPDILDACEKLGLQMAAFNRKDEPEEVKQREGSTLEWGTHRALTGLKSAPDCVYDLGETGKEPVIRVLGETPMAVVEKVERIFYAWQRPGVVKISSYPD